MSAPILSGNEHFTYWEQRLPDTILNFWAWSSSNLLNNTLRGALAEFIVAQALDIPLTSSREDWAEYDLLYEGCRIEVKSSSYLQAWEQKKPSVIRFSIAPSQVWTENQCYEGERIRHSDLYIFCLHDCKDIAIANPLHLDQWKFFIVPTEQINAQLNEQKSLGLSTLLSLNPIETDLLMLKTHIDKLKRSSR